MDDPTPCFDIPAVLGFLDLGFAFERDESLRFLVVGVALLGASKRLPTSNVFVFSPPEAEVGTHMDQLGARKSQVLKAVDARLQHLPFGHRRVVPGRGST